MQTEEWGLKGILSGRGRWHLQSGPLRPAFLEADAMPAPLGLLKSVTWLCPWQSHLKDTLGRADG